MTWQLHDLKWYRENASWEVKIRNEKTNYSLTFFIENIKKFLQFILFRHADMTPVAEIFPYVACLRQDLNYSTKSISWVLMSW